MKNTKMTGYEYGPDQFLVVSRMDHGKNGYGRKR